MKRMKNTLLYIGMFAMTVVGMTSCGKTTKRKLTNDWKVVSYFEEQEFITSNGDRSVSTTTMTESSVTNSMIYEPSTGPGTTNSRTGEVKAHEFSIKKDGTWSYLQEINYPNNGFASYSRTELSGTWSFLKKNKGDDFEKNERIHFNVLKSETQEKNYSGTIVMSENSTESTFLTGENVLVYVVKTSKKDALEIELDKNYVFTPDSGSGHSNKMIKKMTLQ